MNLITYSFTILFQAQVAAAATTRQSLGLNRSMNSSSTVTRRSRHRQNNHGDQVHFDDLSLV